MAHSYERIYAAVRRIPRDRVATYGQIAVVAGLPRQPRLVGYALSAVSDGRSIPWHRVVNAKGELSPRAHQGSEKLQRAMLEREGVEFDRRDRISLPRFRWQPRFRY